MTSKEDAMKKGQVFAGLAIHDGNKGVHVCILYPEKNYTMAISTSIPEIVQEQVHELVGKNISYERPSERILLRDGKHCRLENFSAFSIEAFKHALQRNSR
jgi:hypothetical protein